MKPFDHFEQGPIRPPSEAASLLIRVNRNCPWNRCTFCSIYKKEKFSTRPVEDVLREIDAVRQAVDHLAGDGRSGLPAGLSRGELEAFHAARTWMGGGMESVFLQDADGLVIRPGNLLRILRHLKECFPTIRRITSYARSESIVRLSDELLAEIAAAGLDRLHVGMETAADSVLTLVRKGATKGVHIEAGLKVKRAGMELSEYVLTGLGGREFSREHAVETADALNRINPDFIRFRTLHLPDKIRLFPDSDEHRYHWSTDLVIAQELHTLLSSLDGITSCVKSDHSYNLFQDIDGVLPGDKARLLAIVEAFLALPAEEQMLFMVGKRAGYFLYLSDMRSAGRRAQVEDICRQSGITPDNADERIHEIVQDRMRRGMPF